MMLTEVMTIAELLKDRRKALDLTQEELAEKSGVPLGSVRNYEQGHRIPSIATAAKLARALDLDLNEFAKCEDSGDEPPAPPRRRR